MHTIRSAFFAAAGWIVPGLGHVLSGQRTKGLIYAVTLLGCFLAGEIMSDARAVSRKEHDIAFWAQIGVGGPTLLGAWYDQKRLEQERQEREDRERREGVVSRGLIPIEIPGLLDCGIMYTCVAGLLNFVLLVDLLFPRPRVHRAPHATERRTDVSRGGGAGRD